MSNDPLKPYEDAAYLIDLALARLRYAKAVLALGCTAAVVGLIGLWHHQTAAAWAAVHESWALVGLGWVAIIRNHFTVRRSRRIVEAGRRGR